MIHILIAVDAMKKLENIAVDNYVYWISTALLSLLYLASAILYIVKRSWVRQALYELGYPAYLVSILTLAKILGVAAILSRVHVGLSDLAYAGMLFHLLLSAAAHIGVRKPRAALPAVIGLALMATSFMTQNAARATPSPHAPASGSARIVHVPSEPGSLAKMSEPEGFLIPLGDLAYSASHAAVP